jgi:WXXGXW repeat (2 copies)
MQFSSSIRKVLIAAALTLIPASSFAGVLISVNIAPPALPIYTQPLCPGEGYIWTPGYWAWGSEGYYWVPGVWVQPPTTGVLWTPGYWGWTNGAYIFHAGYWGPHIGFYGGVNYGFGYTGVGYEGGYWNHGVFAYNRSVNNINIVNVHNVYTKTVVVNNYNRVSYNGGAAGIRAQESAQERAAFHEQHFQPTVNQQSHEMAMRADRGQLASVNGGRPHTTAMATVNERRVNQQQRIGNGINSGQMTPGEAARAENRQQQINQQVHADRAANGGHLTQQEHQQVNREQNHASQQVHNEKHNDERAPH